MIRFFSDAVFITASQFVSAIGTFIVQVYVVRTVQVSDYGQYAAIQALVSLVEAVFVARGGEVALQFIGQYWQVDMARALGYRSRLDYLEARLNFLIYFFVVMAGYSLSAVLNFRWGWLALLALTIPSQIGYGVSKGVFIVAGRLKSLAVLEMICTAVFVVLAITCTAWLGIQGLLIALVVNSVVKTALARWFSKDFWSAGLVAVASGYDDELNKSLFRSANIHSIVRNTFMNGASHGDVLLVSALRGPEAAGLYKAAKTIAAIPVRAVAPAWIALRPRIMASWRKHDVHRIRLLLILPGALLTAFGVIGIFPLVKCGEVLVTLAFGDSYRAATAVALWLLLGTWILGAVTGWLNFACAITTRKMAGSLIYLLWFVCMLAGGVVWGKNSATAMAIVATGSMSLTAFAGWACFMRVSAWSVVKNEDPF